MTYENRVSYKGACKTVSGKASCCIPNGLSSLRHVFLQGTQPLLPAAQEREKVTDGMESCKAHPNLETSSPCSCQGFYWPKLNSSFEPMGCEATSWELRAPKSLMPLSPKQIVWSTQDLRGGLSVCRGSPPHWGEGGREHQPPKTRCWLCPRASVLPYCIVAPGEHPPAPLQRRRPGTSSP